MPRRYPSQIPELFRPLSLRGARGLSWRASFPREGGLDEWYELPFSHGDELLRFDEQHESLPSAVLARNSDDVDVGGKARFPKRAVAQERIQDHAADSDSSHAHLVG